MSRITLLAAGDRAAQPWKNGGGQTSEIAVFPPDAGLDDFEWRISMASVEVPGRFSYFSGIDRILAIVEGQLELSFDGEPEPVRLNREAPPHIFHGETGVSGSPVSGKVIDLNLMTRRGLWHGGVERLVAPGGQTLSLEAGLTILVFVGAGYLTAESAKTFSMNSLDAIRIDASDRLSIAIESDHEVFVLNLSEMICSPQTFSLS